MSSSVKSRFPWRRLGELEQRLGEMKQQLRETERCLEAMARRLPSVADYRAVKSNLKQLNSLVAKRYIERGSIPKVETAVPTQLMSKTCVQADIESDWFGFWASRMKAQPTYHRKLWELCYIAQVIHAKGKLHPGSRGLGFGCGREPLPSLFASYGILVTATDQPSSAATSADWMASGQHASRIDHVRRSDICPDVVLLANIDMQAVDMNDVPSRLHGQFDFCWSACALEHLGDIDRGLRFIEESLLTLRPGGVAVHTTEFNFDDSETLNQGATVLFQRKHFEALCEKLMRRGYWVAPFDFSGGEGTLDSLVDVPPYPGDTDQIPLRGQEPPHLKILLGRFVCTSIGMIIEVPQ
jgi:2-polyprenyl-3-methyl-5-hydroxy-6-metoxy-1,4-benzoquinol methylase